VTTPQQVSLADSRRAVRMYQKLKIPTLGLIENMSFYECTNCHHQADIFGHGGGEQVAAQLDIPFLGRLPLYQPIRVGSDRGIPLVIAEPDSEGTRAFMAVAEATMAQLAVSAHKAIAANKGKIPLIQVR
jgi:ATP-binding protein involved in chromosome partitioning